MAKQNRAQLRNDKRHEAKRRSKLKKQRQQASRSARQRKIARAPRPIRGQVERLEDRILLAADFSTNEIRTLLDAQRDQIEGITVITHGYQPFGNGDSLMGLASAIESRAESQYAEAGSSKEAWLLDYDVSGEGLSGGFDNDSDMSGTPGEVILLFDWAPESNEISTGWGEAAGDALFNLP